jgi:RNA polymerase sigma-32 factor
MLAKSWCEYGDPDSAHWLMTSHLRLVVKIAKGYRGYGLPISDVISEGKRNLRRQCWSNARAGALRVGKGI